MRPAREVADEEENFRLEEQMPGVHFTKRDYVEPEPVGSIVLQAFRIKEYQRDCDGSALATLAGIDRNGEETGWEQACIGITPGTDLVVTQEELSDLFDGYPEKILAFAEYWLEQLAEHHACTTGDCPHMYTRECARAMILQFEEDWPDTGATGVALDDTQEVNPVFGDYTVSAGGHNTVEIPYDAPSSYLELAIKEALGRKRQADFRDSALAWNRQSWLVRFWRSLWCGFKVPKRFLIDDDSVTVKRENGVDSVSFGE